MVIEKENNRNRMRDSERVGGKRQREKERERRIERERGDKEINRKKELDSADTE